MGWEERKRREGGRKGEGEGRRGERGEDVEGPGKWSAPGPVLALGGPGHGHTTPKTDLEAWRRHHTRPLGSSSFSSLTFLPADVGQVATSASLAEAETLLSTALVNRLARVTGNRLRVDVSFSNQLYSQRVTLCIPRNFYL